MNKILIGLTAVAFSLGTPGTVLAKHHGGGHDGHKCEKMDDGKMKCCKKDKDGKMTCHIMDAPKADHSKMDHSKMKHDKPKPE
ncbi:hypothetical protein [Parasphingorhabdus sp.]|uniref:hypothetical protein n=1 Tax=Parasphingorhabdus sp. TaxID=2709688 RepID=UPI003D2C67A3